MFVQLLQQLGLAALWYVAVVFMVRLAGKRFVGQIVGFDLIVLITLGVVLQTALLRAGAGNAAVFVATVFGLHRLNGALCRSSRRVRRLIRGAPRPLITDGEVARDALEEEALSYEDLLAGLRKCGHDGPRRVRSATLEETGEISVVPMRDVS